MTPDNSNADDDYRSEHTAPGPHYGAPLHDVSSGGMYPADFYGPKGRRQYASEGWDFDNDAYNKVTRVKDKPNEMVSIHRAIPTSVYNEALKKDAPLKHMIRKGDWVAINKEYARAHGDHVLGKLNKDYKIASMRVPAKHVWTNADSIHEWGYHPDEKATGGIIYKAEGGNVQPSIAQMKMEMAQKGSNVDLQRIGVNEAPNMSPKHFFPPAKSDIGMPSPGGVATPSGMPIGGIDMSKMQGGQQLMPNPLPAPPQPPQGAQPPQGGQPPQPPQGQPPMGAQQGGGNILQMTPQGQMMQALGGGQPPKPPGMAKGGSMSTEDMKAELAEKKKAKGMNRFAGGGQPRPKFAIQPAEHPTKGPEGFTPYDHENPTMKGLATAFDEAIAHHLSLSPEDRAKNSVRASERVADIVGRTGNGAAKDLLGKNQKLLKSEKGYDGGKPVELPDGRGIETSGLALAPAYREGKFDTCPNHQSCKAECLGKTSGNYFKLGGGKDMEEFLGPRLNSLKKTHAFMHAPHDFAVKLHDEISDAKAIAAQNGNHLGLRLNVLSDINPRVHKAIIKAHPDVTFYDYTKNNTDPIAPNHHYTYSSTGVSQPGVTNEHSNWKSMRRRLDQGDNVAMAFSDKQHLPEEVHCQETGKKYKVIDGDTHDFRPLDIQPEGSDGVIIGLKNKKATGKTENAHVDSNGFFVHYDPKLQMDKNAKGQPVYARSKPGSKSMYDTIPQNRSVNIQKQESARIPLSNDDGESK